MFDYKFITDFHGSRKKYLGASDIPTLFGLNAKYGRTWLTLWHEKTGRTENTSIDSEIPDWGHIHEHALISRYLTGSAKEANVYLPAILNGKSGNYNDNIWVRETEFIHPDYNFCGCHPDLLIIEPEEKLVECKSHGLMGAKRYDANSGYNPDDLTPAGIPIDKRMQTQFQMFTTGIYLCDLVALIDTNKYHEWNNMEFNPKFAEKLLTVARRFWDFVEKDNPPPPQIASDVWKLFPKTKTEAMILDEETSNSVKLMKEQYKDYGKKIKKYQVAQKKIQNSAALTLEGCKYLNDFEGEKLATRVETVRENISIKNLKLEYPDIYDKLKESELIKESVSQYLKF